MKILKIAGCFVLIVVILILTIDFYLLKIYKDPVISTLPEYEDKIFFEGGSGSGFTDYGKYIYKNDVDFSKNPYFKRVTEDDIKILSEYEKIFASFLTKEYYKEDYDFSMSLADTQDYLYIANRENKEAYSVYKGNFDAFDIYFYDTQGRTLYFMHSNI